MLRVYVYSYSPVFRCNHIIRPIMRVLYVFEYMPNRISGVVQCLSHQIYIIFSYMEFHLQNILLNRTQFLFISILWTVTNARFFVLDVQICEIFCRLLSEFLVKCLVLFIRKQKKTSGLHKVYGLRLIWACRYSHMNDFYDLHAPSMRNLFEKLLKAIQVPTTCIPQWFFCLRVFHILHIFR